MPSPPVAKSRLSFFGRNKDKEKDKTKTEPKMSRTTSRFSISSQQPITSSAPPLNLPQPPSAAPSRDSAGDYASSFRSSLPTPSSKDDQLRAQHQQQHQAYLQNGSMSPNREQPPQNAQIANRTPAPISGPLLGNSGLQSAVDLIALHPNKVYATSPPTLKVMTAAGPDGKHPKNGPPGTPENDWQEAWVELRGVILHIWIMSEVQEANARGEDKHPTRTNITDAFVDLIQPLPPTRHNPQAGPHPFVFSINTAGMNSVLFSCPDQEVMQEWVTAIRLAGWEMSRLQEIYTGHLLRASGVLSPPQVNRIAGWFDVRTFGSRQWTHLYVVLTIDPSNPSPTGPRRESISDGASLKDKSGKSRNRLSRMFGGSNSVDMDPTPYPPAPGEGSPTMGIHSRQSTSEFGSPTPQVVSAQFYRQPPLKQSSSSARSSVAPPAAPFLTITDVFQALAVFPEVEREVENSAMFKIEGRLSGEGLGRVRRDEGWVLMIPMKEEDNGEGLSPAKRGDMLKWLAAFHDAFGLYGRPAQYSWDARDPKSMFFAHPNGPSSEDFFLTKPPANLDEISVSRPSFVRGKFKDQLVSKFVAPAPPRSISTPAVHSSAQQGQFVPPSRVVQQQQQQQEVQQRPQQQQRTLSSPASNQIEEEPSSATEESSAASKEPTGHFKLPPLSFSSSQQPSQSSLQQPTNQKNEQYSKTQPPLSISTSPLQPQAVRQQSYTGASLPETQPPPNPAFPSRIPLKTTPSFHNVEKSSSLSRKQKEIDPRLAYEDTAASLHSVQTPSASFTSSNQSTRSPSGSPPMTSEPITHGGFSQTHTAPTPSMYSESSSAWTSPVSVQSLATKQPQVQAQYSRSPDSIAPITSAYQAEPPAIEAESNRYSLDLRGSNDHTFVPLDMIETGLPTEEEIRQAESAHQAQVQAQAQPQVQDTPLSPTSSSSKRLSLGRRPSGARAAPPRRILSESTGSMVTLSDNEESPQLEVNSVDHGSNDHNADALAALSFLESPSSPEVGKSRALPSQPGNGNDFLSNGSLPKPQTDLESQPQRPSNVPYPSSFGPSKSAAERRAKLEAAQQQHRDVLSKPGKARSATSRPKKVSKPGAWASSSDDEEEEDEDEEEGEHPVAPKPPRPLPSQPASQNQGQGITSTSSSTVGSRPPRPPSERPPQQSMYDYDLQPPNPAFIGNQRPTSRNSERAVSFYSQQHQPSHLDGEGLHQPIPRPGGGVGNRGVSQGRASVWNTHLEMAHGGMAEQDANRFMTIEQPEARLTKAFNPNGLLQAGLEDRDDRSARRQEEIARSSGASFVNLPAPPPPPQSGLLGAITAHERDRAREGGVGAVLTEKERDRRLAEERARKIDALQREQLEAMSHANGGYPPYYGNQFNSPSPMMGGMPGMTPWGMQAPMSNYGGGYGMDPQAQMAAMMAAQVAYQQAMVSYSQAGSVVGGGGDDHNRYPSPTMPGWGMPNMMQQPQWGYPGPMMGGAGGMAQPLSPMSSMPFLPTPSYPGMGSPHPSFHGGAQGGYPPRQTGSPQGGNGAGVASTNLHPGSRSSTPRSASKLNLGSTSAQ